MEPYLVNPEKWIKFKDRKPRKDQDVYTKPHFELPDTVEYVRGGQYCGWKHSSTAHKEWAKNAVWQPTKYDKMKKNKKQR